MREAPLSAADARRAAEEVEDPELPMVTVGDLGMIRGVQVEGRRATVDVAPTYSGCPATEVIHASVARAVQAAGFEAVEVRLVRNPPWSTSWITPRGRKRLEENGIAPPLDPIPGDLRDSALPLFGDAPAVPCPHCGAETTEQVSAHGSTPCKSLFKCAACQEPFEHFKCH
jgi:ring-1,2-phenylacetyl-CoA epoxidase subunit PaaD